jgi:hypothetical protein
MAAAHPTGPPFVAMRDWLLWVSIGVIFAAQVYLRSSRVLTGTHRVGYSWGQRGTQSCSVFGERLQAQMRWLHR